MAMLIIIGAAGGAAIGAFIGLFFRKMNLGALMLVGALAGLLVVTINGGALGLSGGSIKSSDEFDSKVLESTKPVLVDFFINNCPPCKRLEPVLDELADEFAGRVEFYRLNANEVRDVSAAYGIEATPTVILFVKGEIYETWIGDMSFSSYQGVLDAVAPAKTE